MSLRKMQTQFAGRNEQGKITVRHRGGGHKQAYRAIDWNRSHNKGLIIAFEYDPQRNAPLAKLFHANSSTYSYILAPAGIKLFQEIYTYKEKLSVAKLLHIGDSAPIFFFEAGDFIHAVESYSGQGPVFGRSAGTFCQVMSFEQNDLSYSPLKEVSYFAKVRLPSGSLRLISFDSRATLGAVASPISSTKNLGKAGRTRWLGWRPTVRGVARNPVDHPHGGGQGKTSGGRPSVTFKSWPTKGQPTRHVRRQNPLILTPRKKLMSRSTWKPIFRHPQIREGLQSNVIVRQNRATFITPSIVNRHCILYNGRRWFDIIITKERVGNCIGQYAPTRKRPARKKQAKN